MLCSDFFGGGSNSGSFVFTCKTGGKVKIDGEGALGLVMGVGNGSVGSSWAIARLPSRSLQARTRPSRQINPPTAIHANWVLRVSILAPFGKSSGTPAPLRSRLR